MQTIGERLEEARKRKGVSIREAAETTKIRGDYLQKFEANSFDIDLPPLYIRGFIRTYARFLELDPERLVNEVDNALAREGKPARREQREALGRVDFGAETRAPEAGESGGGNGRSSRDQAALMKLALLGGSVLVGIVVIILLVNVLFSRSPARPAAPTAAETATPTVQPYPAQTIVLTALDATRVKVVQDLDGVVLFNSSLSRGESKSLKKQGMLLITVEDRTKLRIEVNGKLIQIPTFPAQQGNYGQFRLD